MSIEFELKYRSTAEQQAALRQAFPGPAQTILMETVYYDTPSGQLSARHYTLRRRLENGCSICTLKAPAPLGRGEWETPCNDIVAAVPLLCRQGCPEELAMLAREGLISICGARFTRIARQLVLPDCTVELALDSGVLTGGGKSMPLCEVEVELKSGAPAAAAAFAAQLAAENGLVPEISSKFRRALALYRGE